MTAKEKLNRWGNDVALVVSKGTSHPEVEVEDEDGYVAVRLSWRVGGIPFTVKTYRAELAQAVDDALQHYDKLMEDLVGGE